MSGLIPRSLVGVLLSLCSVIFGVLTGVLVKQLGPDINIVTMLFYRFLFSLPILFLFAIYLRGWQFLQINQRKTLFFRSILGCCGIAFWFLSVRSMPLGMATALFQSSVIFITLLSPLLLGEKVGIYRWTAVVAGLTGVVIITDPLSGNMSWYALYGIGAALTGACLSLLLRQLGKGDAPASVAAWYNLAGFGVLTSIVTILPDQLQAISQTVLIDLVFLGVIGSALQIVMTTAYRHSDAVVVASMRYLQMPISGVVGYFLFAEVMSATEIIGALVIIGSCLVIAWRELVRSREVNQPGI
ncbi:MAG: DMT family transporter [Proteobacteria bacterium]|nr:DMT family transporter [Pseudomonadota bacterium]MDA0959715.1 DMT family transporter [Pseudomonadota bacterium]MDA1152237.1 DMT family transporter [Pseudomonadota bacterium]NBP49170.1 DMT family transporter [Alphaproteobacteria bacterium]